MSELDDAGTAGIATNGATPVQVKAGRHREASLYHALGGVGAGNGRTLEQLREAALRTYETSELPVWRRSGFWTTSLQSLDLDALQTAGAGDSIEVEPGVVPDVVTFRPARSAAWRAIFCPVAPCCSAQPRITSSTSSTATPARATACAITCPASVAPCVSLNAPR